MFDDPPRPANPMLPAAAPAWNVAALLLAVADSLNARFGALAVQGELSGYTRATSGHCYFSLKDSGGAQGLIRCAMFRRAAALLDFAPADGQRVQVRGRIAVYEPRGELQFVVESLQRLGAGNLYEEFLRLRARLAALGLFDDGRKRQIKRHPRAIGVITSLGAAALHDVLSAFSRRAPQVPVIVYPCLVQGADAPASIVAALKLAAQRNEVDTLLLVRGGGSIEDLWSFNDERVVRAVAASPLPLVCGVGHETDITLADLAADLRAPTPTAAAELAAPMAADLLAALRAQAQAMSRAVERLLLARAQRLDRLLPRLGAPDARVAAQMRRLDHLAARQSAAARGLSQRQAERLGRRAHALGIAAHDRLARARLGIDTLGGRLHNLDPQRVLERGFSLVQASDGRLLVDPADLSVGQPLRLTMAAGAAAVELARVETFSTRAGKR